VKKILTKSKKINEKIDEIDFQLENATKISEENRNAIKKLIDDLILLNEKIEKNAKKSRKFSKKSFRNF